MFKGGLVEWLRDCEKGVFTAKDPHNPFQGKYSPWLSHQYQAVMFYCWLVGLYILISTTYYVCRMVCILGCTICCCVEMIERCIPIVLCTMYTVYLTHASELESISDYKHSNDN